MVKAIVEHTVSIRHRAITGFIVFFNPGLQEPIPLNLVRTRELCTPNESMSYPPLLRIELRVNPIICTMSRESGLHGQHRDLVKGLWIPR